MHALGAIAPSRPTHVRLVGSSVLALCGIYDAKSSLQSLVIIIITVSIIITIKQLIIKYCPTINYINIYILLHIIYIIIYSDDNKDTLW